MTDWNETGYTERDFLPDDRDDSYDGEAGINQAPHPKRCCDPGYECRWHGTPEAKA